MKLLACVKQIAELKSAGSPYEDGHALTLAPENSHKTNPFDLLAVEECLRLKDALPETTVDVVSVGPERAVDALRKALGMGADRGVHLKTPEEGESDPFSVASQIAAYVRKTSYDLIVTGMMAEDDMYAQVGPLMAEMLSRPCAIAATLVQPSVERKRVYVEREMEGGTRLAEELEFPAIVAVQVGANRPRYPSLSNILRAKNQEMETGDVSPSEQPKPRAVVVRLFSPRKTRSGTTLEGTGEQKAAELLNLLHGKAFF